MTKVNGRDQGSGVRECEVAGGKCGTADERRYTPMAKMCETADGRGWKEDVLFFEDGGLCVGVRFSRGGEIYEMKSGSEQG